MEKNKRAMLELDGERYEEHQAYDPLMVRWMWGYPLTDKQTIARLARADKDIASLFKNGILKPHQSVFVGGARQGSYLFALQEKGLKAQGIEENAEMVSYINSVVPDTRLICARMGELPFEDKTFDVGFFHSSLLMNENTELNRCEVREIKRVLKPQGLLLIEGANGVYWEPVRKKAGDLYEFSSVEEGLWALKKNPSLAQWRRRNEFIWLEFFFITINSEQLRVNHVYHFVPKQEGVDSARYYHEIVNYEPFFYRLKLLDEEGLVNRDGKPLSLTSVYETYTLDKPFNTQTSPGGIILARPADV